MQNEFTQFLRAASKRIFIQIEIYPLKPEVKDELAKLAQQLHAAAEHLELNIN